MILRAATDELRGLPCLGSERRAPLTFSSPARGSSLVPGRGLRGQRRSRSALNLRFWRSAAFPGRRAAQVLLAQPVGTPSECRSSGLGRLKGARASAATGQEADTQNKFLGILSPAGPIFCARTKAWAGSDQERVSTRLRGTYRSDRLASSVRKPVLSEFRHTIRPSPGAAWASETQKRDQETYRILRENPFCK